MSSQKVALQVFGGSFGYPKANKNGKYQVGEYDTKVDGVQTHEKKI